MDPTIEKHNEPTQRKRLKFTCPECGGPQLGVIHDCAIYREQIEAVY
ncbi:hypothetical protein ACFL2Q_07340 [Thermodesulfobacteriota bacterium]